MDESIDLEFIEDLKGLADEEDPNFLAEQIALFHERAIQMIARMRESLAAGKVSDIEDIAHALAGSSGLVGAKLLNQQCSSLEEQVYRGEAEGLEEQVEAIAVEYAKVSKFLDQLV